MGDWTFIVTRWPGRELEIRRRCSSDPVFASVVDDYCEACTALGHWGGIDPPSSARIADYETLVEELESEIEASLAHR